ncbi:MAG TPA: valine--tRNA ligase [Candidatus Paceibacterota bacterium]|jgi:valyl-tRNA synthetase|nr:valine--tRNA ligase [Candidatus Paceibacterota bacterium]
MDDKFRKPYDSIETEARIYQMWEESGYFNPDNLPNATKGPFTIMMPPPNATGVLHMGHMLGTTLQDIIIRFKRMQGYEALYLPGTDHAAIATQARVEKDIQKAEGRSRHDLGRPELLRRIDAFVEESRAIIRKQIRATGASCDWSREAFTLDEPRNRAVRRMFKDMYDAGLIYRGNRIVNWDPKGQTTISDDEIVHEERAGKLYTFKYSRDFPITIATTRPETKVGDTAVAVHPDDVRYQEFIGKEYDLEFMGVPLHIKIVADEGVEPEFGTGALGVTPAHSQTDWEIAEKNDLPRPQVINELAKMTVTGPLNGLKANEAREKVVEWLKEQDLLEKEEDITQNISTAERTGGVIEPLPKLQWFIDVNKPIAARGDKSLKELMLEPVRSGAITILPDHYDKTYYHWIENLRDWCISRQIWYGHRVPVWYRGEEITVGEPPAGNWESDGWKQDEDTLDTWFSSGSWTFSTLGWPDETPDLARFHPTDVLETAYEILFFWVARMILMTEFVLGEIPFKTVYLHGLIRDAQGRKFSKSLGNGIDPIVIIDKYGADAARMSITVGNTPGTDMRLSEDRIKGYKHFANKLWNITRFILENTEGTDLNAELQEQDMALAQQMKDLAADVTKDMEAYRLYMASDKLYQYAWKELADRIIEESKPILNGEDAAAKNSRAAQLVALLRDTLVLLHPFMPFVTEEIWQSLPEHEGMLIVAPWPVN